MINLPWRKPVPTATQVKIVEKAQQKRLDKAYEDYEGALDRLLTETLKGLEPAQRDKGKTK